MTGPLKNVIEAAEWLGIPKASLQAMVSGRTVPFTFVGKHVRFAQEHLDAIVAAGEQVPADVKPHLVLLGAESPPPPPPPPPRNPPVTRPSTPPPPKGPKQQPTGKQDAA